jgi:hypothetical protein
MKTTILDWRSTCAGIALGCVTLVPAEAAVAYQQAYDGSGNAFSSQNDTAGGNGQFAQMYDDFALGSSAAIGNVSWTGSYFNPPSPGTITGWTVGFYADSGGQPGALLSAYNFGGNGSETLLGNIGGNPTYTYSVNLSGAFDAIGGTTYWLSVVPDLGFPPQWGWGTAGAGTSYQDFTGSRSAISSNLAFTLTSAESRVPDSGSTLGLLVAAFFALYIGCRHSVQRSRA